MTADSRIPSTTVLRQNRSDRFLSVLGPFSRVVLVSHVNPDPDALASMLGLQTLIEQKQPGKDVTLTVDGMIARAENQMMVDVLTIPLVPIARVALDPHTAVVMVDSQPRTGRCANEATPPTAVLDHHDTSGRLEGVVFRDIRPNLGATSTIVTGYLLEQDVEISPRLATALLYGIESEISGYPREASVLDDGALVWLFPRADKDLLARIRNPKLPQSHFASYLFALTNAFVYHELLICWCGPVTQPDLVSELADFFIRSEQVEWVVCIGQFDDMLKLSMRVSQIGGRAGEVLRTVVEGLGTAGGHDKRAGGAVPLSKPTPWAIDAVLHTLRRRLLSELGIHETQGYRFIDACAVINAP